VNNLNPLYTLKTDADLVADLRYCRQIAADKAAPDNVRESAKDEIVSIQFEIKARKAMQAVEA
jgi:uncharacterized protein (UPF0147 family)